MEKKNYRKRKTIDPEITEIWTICKSPVATKYLTESAIADAKANNEIVVNLKELKNLEIVLKPQKNEYRKNKKDC